MQKTEVLCKYVTRCGTYSLKLLCRDDSFFIAEYKDGNKWNEEQVASLKAGLSEIESIREEEAKDGIQFMKSHGYPY